LLLIISFVILNISQLAHGEFLKPEKIRFNLDQDSIKLISSELQLDPLLLKELNKSEYQLSDLPLFSPIGESLLGELPKQPEDSFDFSGDCKIPGRDLLNPELKPFIDDLQKVILRSLLSRAERETSGVISRKQLAIATARLYIPDNFSRYTKQQKLGIISSALISGAIFANTFLKEHDIDFNNFFELPAKGLLGLQSIGLNVQGERIGHKSKDPYLQATTTLNFLNDFSLSLSAGSSRNKHPSSIGRQHLSLLASFPYRTKSFIHKLKLLTGINRTYAGKLEDRQILSQDRSAGLSYDISQTPRDYNLDTTSRLSTSISILPILATEKTIFAPNQKGEDSTYIFSNGIGATLRYRILDLDPFEGTLDLNTSALLSIGDGADFINSSFVGTLNFSIHPKSDTSR